ncbi:hypothetical protein NQD90_07535, partial [Escherichia coli]|nr:hypothetical protein [Escherichia coli]
MNEFPVVLVINCGSSSIKFSVLNASDCEVLMSGIAGNDSNLLIVFYVQIMPDDFVMQLHR